MINPQLRRNLAIANGILRYGGGDERPAMLAEGLVRHLG